MTIDKYEIVLTATSPLVHGSDEKAGIDTLFRRQRFITEAGSIDLPIISGNALRGRLRRIAADRFCRVIGLGERSLPVALYYSMFSGGAIDKGATGNKLGIADRSSIRRNIPFLSLFGCAWGGDIIQGKLLVSHLLPICAETAALTGIEESRSIHEFLDEYALTRKDDRESAWIKIEDKKPGKPKDSKSVVQMLYRVETLCPGTRLTLTCLLDDVSDNERACFDDVLAAWQENPTIGGRASGGFGKLNVNVNRPLAVDYAERLTATYKEGANEITAWWKALDVNLNVEFSLEAGRDASTD